MRLPDLTQYRTTIAVCLGLLVVGWIAWLWPPTDLASLMTYLGGITSLAGVQGLRSVYRDKGDPPAPKPVLIDHRDPS